MERASTTERGARAEQLAVARLEREGYRIVRRNFRAPGGEIDIIAWDGDVLCFVEVRSRDEHVRISKSGNTLVVEVDADGNRVNVSVPLGMVSSVLAFVEEAAGYTLDEPAEGRIAV